MNNQITKQEDNSLKHYKKEAIIEALQNPITLSAISVCGIATVFTLLVAPFTGGILISGIIAGASGLFSIGSALRSSIFKSNTYLEGKINEAETNRKEQVEALILSKINEQEQTLTLSNKKFKRGNKAFSDIKNEYDNLILIFENKSFDTALIDPEKIKWTVTDLYSKGLGFLKLSYEISKQLDVTNCADLLSENIELEQEIKTKESNDTMLTSLRDKINNNLKTIALVKKHKDRIDELICQVGLCKDAIREIRLELPELLSHESKDDVEKILLELGSRIEFAQRLQEEYERQGITK